MVEEVLDQPITTLSNPMTIQMAISSRELQPIFQSVAQVWATSPDLMLAESQETLLHSRSLERAVLIGVEAAEVRIIACMARST